MRGPPGSLRNSRVCLWGGRGVPLNSEDANRIRKGVLWHKHSHSQDKQKVCLNTKHTSIIKCWRHSQWGCRDLNGPNMSDTAPFFSKHLSVSLLSIYWRGWGGENQPIITPISALSPPLLHPLQSKHLAAAWLTGPPTTHTNHSCAGLHSALG